MSASLKSSVELKKLSIEELFEEYKKIIDRTKEGIMKTMIDSLNDKVASQSNIFDLKSWCASLHKKVANSPEIKTTLSPNQRYAEAIEHEIIIKLTELFLKTTDIPTKNKHKLTTFVKNQLPALMGNKHYSETEKDLSSLHLYRNTPISRLLDKDVRAAGMRLFTGHIVSVLEHDHKIYNVGSLHNRINLTDGKRSMLGIPGFSEKGLKKLQDFLQTALGDSCNE